MTGVAFMQWKAALAGGVVWGGVSGAVVVVPAQF
jgi:hypothetical protein